MITSGPTAPRQRERIREATLCRDLGATFTARDVARFLGCAQLTARLRMRELVAEGSLEQVTSRPYTVRRSTK